MLSMDMLLREGVYGVLCHFQQYFSYIVVVVVFEFMKPIIKTA
jgi:hypothetical protein